MTDDKREVRYLINLWPLFIQLIELSCTLIDSGDVIVFNNVVDGRNVRNGSRSRLTAIIGCIDGTNELGPDVHDVPRNSVKSRGRTTKTI